MATYKGFTYNASGAAAPWSSVEVSLLQDIMATLVMGCCSEEKDTAGHKHYQMHRSDGSATVLSSDASGVVTLSNTAVLRAGGANGLRLQNASGNGCKVNSDGDLQIDANEYLQLGHAATFGSASVSGTVPMKTSVGQTVYLMFSNTAAS